MKIRVRDIPEEGLNVDLSEYKDILGEALNEISTPPGMEVSPELKGALRVLADEKQLTMYGGAEAEVTLSCARCLRSYKRVLDLEISMLWNLGPGPQSDTPLYPQEDEDGVPYFEDEELDPGLTILQEILLSIPMKPLCDEECPGLCPVCGAMAGSEQCACPAEDNTDPRWDKLKDLRDKLGDR